MAFVRRFTSLPTLATLLAIEAINVVDIVPPNPVIGAGTGTVLLVGEFEDGPFATDQSITGSQQVFGSDDFRNTFGGFGYIYSNVVANNPSARKHLGECWNGNGYLKAFKLSAQGLLVARVDTSVGSVTFDVLANIDGGVGPFVLAVGQTLAITTDTGTGTTAALTATAATQAGSAQAFSTIVAGDAFSIAVDGGPAITVTFSASDINQAAVLARINATLGFACASTNTTQIDLTGIQKGTGGKLVLADVTTGCLAKIGHSAGTVNGTSNIAANIAAVTVAEVVALINGTAGITTAHGKAVTTPTGALRLINTQATSVATISVAAGAMATALGLSPIGSTVARTAHAASTIPAGTRLHASGSPGLEWVVMQTTPILANATDPITVKVRPGQDDGTQAGVAAASVDTVVDAIGLAVTVNNGSALSAALSEAALDAAYTAALNATLNPSGPARVANYLLIARRSDSVVRAGVSNALTATSQGLFARKYVSSDQLGTLVAQSLVNVANFRSQRLFYSTKGLKVQIPEIATRGTAGGVGFTSDGIITVRPDGPLTTICAMIPPEENPGEQTDLINDFFQVASDGETLTIDTYTAWKAAGICAPIVDLDTGSTEFQSGVTSSLTSGHESIARRKMADFIQDTVAIIGKPYSKQLNRQSKRDKLRGQVEQFLAGLKSEGNAENQRIVDYSVSDGADAGNTASTLALGVYYLRIVVQTLSSLDAIVFVTEIGPNAVISRAA